MIVIILFVILIISLSLFGKITDYKDKKYFKKTEKKIKNTPLTIDFIYKYLKLPGTYINNVHNTFHGIKKGLGPWVFILLSNYNSEYGDLVISYNWESGDKYRVDWSISIFSVYKSLDITEEQFVSLINKITGINLSEFKNYYKNNKLIKQERANQGVNLLG